MILTDDFNVGSLRSLDAIQMLIIHVQINDNIISY
jgi:hypothetical protein